MLDPGWIVVIVSILIVPVGAAALFFWAALNEICDGWLAVFLPGLYVMLSVPLFYLLMMFEHWGVIPPGG